MLRVVLDQAERDLRLPRGYSAGTITLNCNCLCTGLGSYEDEMAAGHLPTQNVVFASLNTPTTAIGPTKF
jgi:hypothetical protein